MRYFPCLLVIILSCIMFSLLWSVCGLAQDEYDLQTIYTIPRHIRYSYTLQNRTDHMIRGVQFWTYGPVSKTPSQRCVKLTCSHPYEVITDFAGNQIMHVTFREFPPYDTKIIGIDADLMLSQYPAKENVRDLSAYLKAEQYIEKDNPAIRVKANELKQHGTVSTVLNIAQWIKENIAYSGYTDESLGALWSLTNRKADCTEIMYLFSALCRVHNIPVRCVEGYRIDNKVILEPNTYHDWAEFYHDGTWQIADPMKGNIMKNQSHYVVMRIIINQNDKLGLTFHRFRYRGDGLAVFMN